MSDELNNEQQSVEETEVAKPKKTTKKKNSFLQDLEQVATDLNTVTNTVENTATTANNVNADAFSAVNNTVNDVDAAVNVIQNLSSIFNLKDLPPEDFNKFHMV